MAKAPLSYSTFNGGIADFNNSGIENSYAFGRSVDVRTNPNEITVLPRTLKESGNVVTDLPKWASTSLCSSITYMYGNTGNLYARTSAGSYSFLRTVANSHGNGMVYSAEDDFLYYTADKVIGRYGPLCSGTAAFVDDFFGSQGGTPLNTHSLDLESSSSQYASRADTATLSITSSLAIDCQIKPESLPAVGSQMVLVSKWDEVGTTRSYKFDISSENGYFGDGSDGALTISGNTTDAPIDSACTGTSGASTLSATNASFAAGQVILIHQTQGTGAGAWMRNKIISYTAGTITLETVLNTNYVTGAQVIVMKQYTTVTVNSGITWTAKAWNGTVGGILAFLANTSVTGTGTITAAGKGFRGGASRTVGVTPPGLTGYQGEGTTGAGTIDTSANGSGGGGGSKDNQTSGCNGAGGGGGGNGAVGTNGENGRHGTYSNTPGGTGGAVSGSADLTTLLFGGGGGSPGTDDTIDGTTGAGGTGGGIIFIAGTAITFTGSVTANGGAGAANSNESGGGAGGGAGGSIILKAQTATLGTVLTTAIGGAGRSAGSTVEGGNGGDGGTGRIHLDYYTSYTGTTNPTLDVTQDNTLVTNTGYILRLSLSSTGLNSEVLSYPFDPQIAEWQQVGVSWEAASFTATFYVNGLAIGSRTGAFTAIHDNASRFAIGASYNGAGAAANFYDGLIDEVRLFGGTRSASDMLYGLQKQIATNTVNMKGYYKLNNGYTDATANANDLTATNTPVFSIDVPYPSPTTRLDIDLSASTSSQTYAVPTAISEAASDRLTITPTHDPQKSVQFNVSNIGTGTWTVTVHDQFNNTLATSTVLTADMRTGTYEFIFSDVWSPLTNFTNNYHFHITCASGSPTVVTGSSNNLETADYVTYYQFLAEDTSWHPLDRCLNFWIVGNGRYVGKYDATLYEPNEIVLQAGQTVRCFADFREYKAIGCMKGSTITETEQGRIYFWDGIADTFNFSIDVPEGGINAMLGSRGKLFIWAGYKNQLLVYEGGDSANKLRDMPKMENAKYSEIYPQAVTMYQSLLRYGVAGNGDSTAIQKGVYTYGSTNYKYPEILTYDYPISTGNTSGTNVKIGLTAVVGGKLLIGWQDGTGYGVDYVSAANAPYASSMVEFLIEDNGAIWKEKEAVEIAVNYSTLLTGEAISLRYALEGSTTFTSNLDSTAVGDTVSRMMITAGRYNEMQVGIDITAAATTAPTIKGLVLLADLNEGEQRLG